MDFINEINKDIASYYENNLDTILEKIDVNKYSFAKAITSLIEKEMSINEDRTKFNFIEKTNEFAECLFANEDLADIVDNTHSFYLTGLMIMSIGASFINIDEFADGTIKKLIDNKQISKENIKELCFSNISRLSKETTDRLSEMFYDDNDVEEICSDGMNPIEKYNAELISAATMFKYIDNGEVDLKDFLFEADKDKIEFVINILKKNALSKKENCKATPKVSLKDKVLNGDGTVDEIIEYIKQNGPQCSSEIYDLYKGDMLNNVAYKMLKTVSSKSNTPIEDIINMVHDNKNKKARIFYI